MNSPEYPSIQTQCLPQEQKDGEDGVASVIPQAKQDVSDHLQTYERLLGQRNIPPKARPYFLRWAITWCATVSSVNASSTEEFFHEQGRRPGLKAWQFQQGVRAVALLARDLLGIPWAQSYDWGGLADTAKPLEADHRTLGRESIPVAPAISSRNIIIDASSGEGKPLPETAEEVSRISEALRRAIRRNGLSYSTEQTYVGWNARFTRFCLLRLKQAPQDAGPQGITDYLNYLALKRNVSASTQRQALNAMVFLTRKVFEQPDFILEKPTPGRPRRRPPVVLTRAEIQSLIAFLENPWKLAAQLMYGSGLRLMEALRLRVKDIDFGQGTILVHDGKGGKHRVVPLPRALEARFQEHLAIGHKNHAQDLAVGEGAVHMPEALLRKYPKATREWAWQYVFPSATLSAHPRTRRVARFHVHEASMQRQFKEATRKPGSPNLQPATFLCHPPPGKRGRHPHRAGSFGARGRFHHHDLSPCAQTPRSRRAQSLGHDITHPIHHRAGYTRIIYLLRGATGAEIAFMPLQGRSLHRRAAFYLRLPHTAFSLQLPRAAQ